MISHTHTSEMDLLVRFFDNSTNTANTRIYDSFSGFRFLGHAAHQDIHERFNDISSELESNKIFQINVVTERSEYEQH